MQANGFCLPEKKTNLLYLKLYLQLKLPFGVSFWGNLNKEPIYAIVWMVTGVILV